MGEYTVEETLKNVKGEVHEAKDAHEDPFLTNQQLTRDRSVTQLFEAYIGAYTQKINARAKYQKCLFCSCLGIVLAFSVALAILILTTFPVSSENTLSGITSAVTACVSFVVLIVELLKIITKYCFPDNDEQYITEIVKAIQSNDLENKRLNIENGHGGSTVPLEACPEEADCDE